MQYSYKYQSPLGEIMLASDGQCLTGLWFLKQKYFADTITSQPLEEKLPIFERSKDWLDCYFGGSQPNFLLPVHFEGTEFRHAVWEILQAIPYGEVITY